MVRMTQLASGTILQNICYNHREQVNTNIVSDTFKELVIFRLCKCLIAPCFVSI